MSTPQEVGMMQGQPAPAEPQVETPAVETTVDPSVEAPETQAEDVEPDESAYTDPAEYRKALKDHLTRKARAEADAERKKEFEGLLGEVKRQRQGKRALARQLESVVEYVQTMDQRLAQLGQQPSVPLAEPEPHKFATPQEYAKAYAAWESTRAQPVPAAQPQPQQPQAPAVDNRVWHANFAAAVQSNPQFASLVETQKAKGIGNDMADAAVSTMMASPVGLNIYAYLVANPSVTEDIEDMPKADQVRAIKMLEQQMSSRAWMSAPAAPAPAQAPAAPVVPPVQKPAIPPPPPAPAGGGARVAPKDPRQAKTAAEYHRLRMAELRGQKRR